MGARLLSIASAVPERVLTNHDLEKRVDTSDEWIVTRTGIRERRVMDDDENVSDLAAAAGREAIEKAGLDPREIDAFILGTATGDTVFPSTACWAQPKIGLRRIPAFDINTACSGFLYGYQLADSLIASGRAEHVLIIGAEGLSRVMNWKDRSTCVLFGDGAGAAVVGKGVDGRGLIADSWGADGALAELLWQPAGGTRFPASEDTLAANRHTVHMAGNEVFKHAVKAMQRSVTEVMERSNVDPDDIELFVPHQANVRIMSATADRAGISMDKVHLTIDKYGNTSAASIPMALADAEKAGRLKPGTLVLAAAFGAGFTWGAALFRW